MATIKIKDGRFYCGFCVDENGKPTITQTDVRTAKGDGNKGTVSNTIICRKCGRDIPQSNQIK